MTSENGHFSVNMEKQISKTEFKAHALELMREIETSGNELVITTHGKPKLVIHKYVPKAENPLQKLAGSVIKFDSPFEPIGTDDWELA